MTHNDERAETEVQPKAAFPSGDRALEMFGVDLGKKQGDVSQWT